MTIPLKWLLFLYDDEELYKNNLQNEMKETFFFSEILKMFFIVAWIGRKQQFKMYFKEILYFYTFKLESFYESTGPHLQMYLAGHTSESPMYFCLPFKLCPLWPAIAIAILVPVPVPVAMCLQMAIFWVR